MAPCTQWCPKVPTDRIALWHLCFHSGERKAGEYADPFVGASGDISRQPNALVKEAGETEWQSNAV
jgi:hypothetical protein